MINAQSLDLGKLPFVSLDQRSNLPAAAAR